MSGLVVSLSAYLVVLAVQFLAAHLANADDPTPKASFTQLVVAWWVESLRVPRVFCWAQPFASRRAPDQTEDAFSQRGRRGVVLVHGFLCNRGLWAPWLARLKKHRRAFVAVNLEPVFGSIDRYATLIDRAITQVTQATGMPPLIICHSMGGLAVRAWLQATHSGGSRVHHIVTIGSPHGGTKIARFAYPENVRQMSYNSAWLVKLKSSERGEDRKLFTCFYSNCDNIVFPASTATLPGADNRHIPGVPHLELAYHPKVMAESWARL